MGDELTKGAGSGGDVEKGGGGDIGMVIFNIAGVGPGAGGRGGESKKPNSNFHE